MGVLQVCSSLINF
jgi:hypothetical protein